ncbi:transketolase [Deinococcus hopiensis]|uniref:Transketolase n=1 Tax=Deinococcus hopiensis KR-140 TaxID=695939 RepID=A0A1W1U9F5_9DEIO|nr:transketolase [Deinococcus hopiensis]SMB77709.1 transketolase [Deinococcus hopiensis KR-140]
MTQTDVEPNTALVEANALRILAMDAVEAANSGHPGMPMGMADIAEALWRHHLRHNPRNPDWPDRDRFVLSNGHGSMLLYALLHLSGYDLPLEELQNFRQWHSRTPGHPERGYTPGVETTTGPLGQGLANAVGMALAERLLANEFNVGEHEVVNHHTYVFLGDGCLMEGLSHEACSLAGTWGLHKLICFYDDNGISIDGHVEPWFSHDVPGVFRAYGWNVIETVDGHNQQAILAAIEAAKGQAEKPTLICCQTVIGQGAPNKSGTHDVHGAPLGKAEVQAVREALGWPHAPFVIPSHVRAAWNAQPQGEALEREWQARFDRFASAHPERAQEFRRRLAGGVPDGWDEVERALFAQALEVQESVATRKASQLCLEQLVPALPELIGGSADLSPSNLTRVRASVPVMPHGDALSGNYVQYGVREFGMMAIMNGLATHGGFLPYGGTFLIFSDYARNAIRMAALMRLKVLYVLTHDSIGVGEDGPTHQPVEHAAALRLIPNLNVWRPADQFETATAWTQAVRANGPSALLLSRQNLPQLQRDTAASLEAHRGGYVLQEASGAQPQLVLIATGSEVHLAVQGAAQLEAEGVPTRVVSMPSTTVFDLQDEAYRSGVLPRGVPRVAVEAAHVDGWWKYVGLDGEVVGLSTFGESAPAPRLYREFGVTVEHIVRAGQRVTARAERGEAYAQ